MPFRTQRGCPGCGSSFASCRTKGYSYERCTRCLGVWISQDVLQHMVSDILAESVLNFEKATHETSRACPDCHRPMTHLSLFRIPLDRCAHQQHGVWLDKDELRQVLERVGDPEPAAPEPPSSFTSLLGDFFRS